MIDRRTVLDCAEVVGFGGQSRSVMLPKLMKFAALIAERQRASDAEQCYELGLKFSNDVDDFRDGQMDGAYQCAELLAGKHVKDSQPS